MEVHIQVQVHQASGPYQMESTGFKELSQKCTECELWEEGGRRR